MTAEDCASVQAAAPELALDVLPGPERAAVIEHIRRCAECRRTVEGLAGVADALLLLAPPAEPPAGFEAQVLTLTSSPPAVYPSRRRGAVLLAAAAAVVAVAVAVAGGWALGRAEVEGDARVATFLAADGGEAGRVVLTEGTPDEMVCVFEDPRFGGGYTVELVLDDGQVVDAGAFWADDDERAWATDIAVDASDVEYVRVRSEDGEVRSTATF